MTDFEKEYQAFNICDQKVALFKSFENEFSMEEFSAMNDTAKRQDNTTTKDDEICLTGQRLEMNLGL